MIARLNIIVILYISVVIFPETSSMRKNMTATESSKALMLVNLPKIKKVWM
jgi:hypothetical protein